MQSYQVMVLVYIIKYISAKEDNLFRSTFLEGFKIPCVDTSPRCVKDSVEAVFPDFVRGIPSLAIVPLDPFMVNKVNLDMPGGLTIEFDEGQIKGLRKCAINSASVIDDRFNIILHCNFTIKGKYRSYGKMLMFPIDGKGDATIVCKNLKVECSFKLGMTERSGNKYFELKEHSIRHNYQGQVFYKISNLFKGNPEMSNVVLEFMNRNSLAVAEEFGDPVVNLGFQAIVNNVEKLIHSVPADQLFKKN